MTRRLRVALSCALLTFAPCAAHADVAPADTCTSVGQSCQNAPPDYHTSGICRPSTCYRSLPGPDGGRRPMAYDCTLCTSGAGSGGAGAGGGASAGGSGGATVETSGGDSGCACVVSPARAGGALAALLVVMGALALLVDRRSRRS